MRVASLPSLVLVVLLVPTTASARRVPPERPPQPPAIPRVLLENARIENRAIRVRCELASRELADCEIVAELDVVPTGEAEARFALDRDTDANVSIEPALETDPQNGTYVVPAEARARVRITRQQRLATGTRAAGSDYILIADALFMRHLWLATRSRRMGGDIAEPGVYATALFLDVAEQEGTVAVEASLPDHVELRIDETPVQGTATLPHARFMVLSLAALPQDDQSGLRHGGPFLGLGEQLAGERVPERFVMRAGYELGLHDWVILSASIETDFATRFTSALLVEAATPPFFFLLLGFPSLSAGLGATWDISDRGHRAGLRTSIGAGLPVVSFQATFDYYPSDDETVTTLMGRLSF